MKRAALVVLALALLISSVSGVHAADGSPFRFDDVQDAGKFYYEPVYWACGHEPQITNGMTPDAFLPDALCTRAQIVTFLWRAAGEPEFQQRTVPFTDVESTRYYYRPLLWAIEEHITNGISDSRFGTDQSCTRAQAVTFLWRCAGSPEPKSAGRPFEDVDQKAYYYQAVLWAAEKGITNGADAAHFRPDAACTRGHIVTFLYRAKYEMRVKTHTHSYVKGNTVPPGCGSNGYTVYRCSACGNERHDDYIPKTEKHDFTQKNTAEKYLKSAATCASPAVYYYSCRVCGAKGTETFTSGSAVGHDYREKVVTPATHEQNGRADHVCIYCGKSNGQVTETPKVPYDVNAAMAAGNAAIQARGGMIDYSNNADNSGYYPAQTNWQSYCITHGGQAELNAWAVGYANMCVDNVAYAYADPSRVYFNCYIEYNPSTEIYTIWVFYS